ncbi:MULTISPECIES: hypothetical protein [Streptomyces]|uniref:hypothetical protein n=1 Tax=Streptomyces TaxID=1883 RepID=UPI002248FA7B|nr:hypothetical protein [Streptomyces sp. JHD 1]MCX2970044.1 hypothetical protein [Streptomyces sp. JHD 1]
MRKTKPLRSEAPQAAPDPAEGAEQGAEEPDDPYDSVEIYRVSCPRCAQPIALLADEERLPEHALCATPWNPFGLTVCRGSGLPVTDAPPADDGTAQEFDAAALLTLPAGLDWRTQPFSHAAGPGR